MKRKAERIKPPFASKAVYRKWLQKKEWELEDAEYLISGYDPIIRRNRKYVGFLPFVNERLSHLHALTKGLQKEVWAPLKINVGETCPVERIVQWVYDSGFNCDDGFYKAITHTESTIELRDNSWRDIEYLNHLKRPSWTHEEAAKLLAGVRPSLKEDDFHYYYSLEDRINENYRELLQGHQNKQIKGCLKGEDGTLFFCPTTTVLWAAQFKLCKHRKLIEYATLLANGYPADIVPVKMGIMLVIRHAVWLLSDKYRRSLDNVSNDAILERIKTKTISDIEVTSVRKTKEILWKYYGEAEEHTLPINQFRSRVSDLKKKIEKGLASYHSIEC